MGFRDKFLKALAIASAVIVGTVSGVCIEKPMEVEAGVVSTITIPSNFYQIYRAVGKGNMPTQKSITLTAGNTYILELAGGQGGADSYYYNGLGSPNEIRTNLRGGYGGYQRLKFSVDRNITLEIDAGGAGTNDNLGWPDGQQAKGGGATYIWILNSSGGRTLLAAAGGGAGASGGVTEFMGFNGGNGHALGQSGTQDTTLITSWPSTAGAENTRYNGRTWPGWLTGNDSSAFGIQWASTIKANFDAMIPGRRNLEGHERWSDGQSSLPYRKDFIGEDISVTRSKMRFHGDPSNDSHRIGGGGGGLPAGECSYYGFSGWYREGTLSGFSGWIVDDPINRVSTGGYGYLMADAQASTLGIKNLQCMALEEADGTRNVGYGDIPNANPGSGRGNGVTTSGVDNNSASVGVEVTKHKGQGYVYIYKKLATVTIDPNGGYYKGTTQDTVFQVDPNTDSPIDTPNKPGYTFEGWDVITTPSPGNPPGTLEDPNGKGNNTLHVKEDDITIKAKWKLIEYNITYLNSTYPYGVSPGNVNNIINPDILGNPKTFNVETPTFTIKNPSASGLRFLGWTYASNDANYNSNLNILKGTVPDSGNTIYLYAHWQSLPNLPLRAEAVTTRGYKSYTATDLNGRSIGFDRGGVDLNWYDAEMVKQCGGYYIGWSTYNGGYQRWNDSTVGGTGLPVDYAYNVTSRNIKQQTATDRNIYDKVRPGGVGTLTAQSADIVSNPANSGRYVVKWNNAKDYGSTYWFRAQSVFAFYRLPVHQQILLLTGCPLATVETISEAAFKAGIPGTYSNAIMYGWGGSAGHYTATNAARTSAIKLFRYHYMSYIDQKIQTNFSNSLNYFNFIMGGNYYVLRNGTIDSNILAWHNGFGYRDPGNSSVSGIVRGVTYTPGSGIYLTGYYTGCDGHFYHMHITSTCDIFDENPLLRIGLNGIYNTEWSYFLTYDIDIIELGMPVYTHGGSMLPGFKIDSGNTDDGNNFKIDWSAAGSYHVDSDIVGNALYPAFQGRGQLRYKTIFFKHGSAFGIADPGNQGPNPETADTSNTANCTITTGVKGYLVRETPASSFTIANISDGVFVDGNSLNEYTTGAIIPNQAKYVYVAAVDGAGNIGPTSQIAVYVPGTPGPDPARYKVVYDGNGATGGSTPDQNNLELNRQYTFSNNGFTREGYKFKSWNTKDDGTGITHLPGQTFMNLAGTNSTSVTLYAIWEPISYNVHYNPNGGTTSRPGLVPEAPNPETHKYDEDFNLKTKIYYRQGHVLERWSKTTPISPADYNNIPSMSVKTYYLGERVRNIADALTTDGQTVELHAVWRRKTFWIQFDGNENTGGTDPDPIKGEWDVPVQLPDPPYEKDGYEFIGWEFGPVDNDPETDYPYDPEDDRYEDKPDGTGNPTGGKIVNPIPPGKDDIDDGEIIILHAKWRKKVTLRYDYNQGLDSAGNSTNYTWGYIYNNMDAITFDIISTEPNRYPVNTSISPTGYLYDFMGWTVNPVLYPDENKNPWEEHFIREEPDGVDADGNPKFKRIYCRAGELRWSGSTLLGPIIDAADGGGTRADKYTITGLKNNTKNEEWLYGVWKVRHWSGAGISRTLGPNSDPIVFQRGERGIIRVDGKGFVDKIDITFPGAIARDEHYDIIIDPYDKMDGHYDHNKPSPDYIDDVLDNFTKGHGFNIPLYFGGDNWSDQLDNDIHVDVHFTYKGDETVHPYDFKYVVSETILDELRTRIRIRLREPDTP